MTKEATKKTATKKTATKKTATKKTATKKTATKKKGLPKSKLYFVQNGHVIYNYRDSKSRETTQRYHKVSVSSSSRKAQNRLTQASRYNKEYQKLQELRANAAAMGVYIPNIEKQAITYSTNPRIAEGEIRAIKNYMRKNDFQMGEDGRAHNMYVIKQYNKAVEKSNEARSSISKKILGKTKTQGGKSIRNGLRYERLTKSDIKTMGGDLSTRYSEYSTERGLTDAAILSKAKTLQKGANELSGKNKNSLFKSNYLKGLRQQMKDGVLTKEQYKELKEAIGNITTAELLEWYYREEYSQIGFIYSVDESSKAVQTSVAGGLVTSLTKFAKKKARKRG